VAQTSAACGIGVFSAVAAGSGSSAAGAGNNPALGVITSGLALSSLPLKPHAVASNASARMQSTSLVTRRSGIDTPEGYGPETPRRAHHLRERTPTACPETGGLMTYRYLVPWFSLSLIRRIAHIFAVILALALLAAACGGSANIASGGADDAQTDASTDETAIGTPDPTPTDVPIVTSTPLPAATPLPTSTPVPLEAPTPSSVLLTTAFTNSSQVTTVGIDEVFFGMTPEDAAVAASTEWNELPSGNGQCYRVTPANGPDRLVLWVVDGFIERLDIEHPDIRTRSKLGVGNTVAELRSQLGDRLTVETTGDGGQVLEDDQVVRYRSGRIGIIQRASETC
jgi:hypothetical protein